ncbi:MAG: Crp/Fnr family transcriptional regulator [Hyphomonadaceae bacterium]|jgi:CRP-like cAMP-binding protein|nr:Crp/Fnr family transcriptional regulator [Hyphomonadaceae bacterium]
MLAMLGGEASLGNISADTRAKLIAASRTLRVAAGRVLFHKGDAPDCCYLILKGAVKVSLPSKDGQDTLLAVLGRGDMVGEMALLDQQPRSATVTALKSCELCQLPTTTLEWLAREDTAVFRQLLTVLSARVRASNEISHIQQMPLKARLARALLRLAQGFGERLPDGRVLIRQKLSQAELGRMVGAARENINRQVADWSKAKVLSRVSGYYCIQSLQALERLADLDAR